MGSDSWDRPLNVGGDCIVVRCGIPFTRSARYPIWPQSESISLCRISETRRYTYLQIYESNQVCSRWPANQTNSKLRIDLIWLLTSVRTVNSINRNLVSILVFMWRRERANRLGQSLAYSRAFLPKTETRMTVFPKGYHNKRRSGPENLFWTSYGRMWRIRSNKYILW